MAVLLCTFCHFLTLSQLPPISAPFLIQPPEPSQLQRTPAHPIFFYNIMLTIKSFWIYWYYLSICVLTPSPSKTLPTEWWDFTAALIWMSALWTEFQVLFTVFLILLSAGFTSVLTAITSPQTSSYSPYYSLQSESHFSMILRYMNHMLTTFHNWFFHSSLHPVCREFQ